MQQQDNNNQTYGRYKVIRLLGEGAMGRVYLSEDPILMRQVAVKVISTDRHLDPIVLSEYLTRFTIEAQSCAKLNHPSVVSIYDAGEQDGVPWIAFEFVDGERLDALIVRVKRLPFDRVARIAGDIAAAMLHAHSQHVVHRDIKPANILIDGKSGIAKLADFGVVKAPFTAITQSGTAVGSPGYMSPEQIDNLEVDARSDIFSFGIVLYQMITGEHPFLRDTVQATFFATVSCNYTPISKLRPDTPEGLVRIVEKSLVADRNKRIMDAEKLCSMISECLDGGAAGGGIMSVGMTAGSRVAGLTSRILSRARRVCARIARSAGSFAKKRAPALQTKTAIMTGWVKSNIVSTAKQQLGDAYHPIKERFRKPRVVIALTAAAALISVAVAIALFSAISARSGDERNIVRVANDLGYGVKNSKQLIDTCKAYASKCDYKNVDRIADILSSSKNGSRALRGSFFKAVAALCAGRFNDAADLFDDVLKLKGGENAIRGAHPFFIRYLDENWIQRELPDALVFLCAQRLFLHESHQMKVWLKDKRFWVHWNAVNILQTAGKSVDLVPIYILDLENAMGSRTRERAAEKLGELGDRRAVPALIAARDNRDNAASATARRVLREKFNVW